MGAVPPKLGHPHHDGQDRYGAVGAAGPVGHGREPILDMLDGDGVHGEMAEGGQDVLTDQGGDLQTSNCSTRPSSRIDEFTCSQKSKQRRRVLKGVTRASEAWIRVRTLER